MQVAGKTAKTIAFQDDDKELEGLAQMEIEVDGFAFTVAYEGPGELAYFIKPHGCDCWLDLNADAFSSSFERDVHAALSEAFEEARDYYKGDYTGEHV